MAKPVKSPKQPELTFIPCTEMSLAPGDMIAAAARATEINPANAPAFAPDIHPILIAVQTQKYWGAAGRKFGVTFLDNPTVACRNKILAHMNAWNTRCNTSFTESSQGEVRITRGPSGYWSYLGTDILSIQSGQPTMNLQGFTENTSDSEYKRVVRHETGHTLGCVHEHLRKAIVDLLDANKTIAYFLRTQGWNQSTTIHQVLTAVAEVDLLASTTTDQDSVMCYQLPGACTKNGRPIVGGVDITENDFLEMMKLYPKPDAPIPPPPPPPGADIVSLPVAVAAAVKALTDLGFKITR